MLPSDLKASFNKAATAMLKRKYVCQVWVQSSNILASTMTLQMLQTPTMFQKEYPLAQKIIRTKYYKMDVGRSQGCRARHS